MSSSEDDWMDDCPTDLDPRIFRRIVMSVCAWDSGSDIHLLEQMKKRKLTKDEKDAANIKKEESEVEDAEKLFLFIKKSSKLEEKYTYKGETYSDQINETLKLLRNWSEITGMDRDDEHRGVGDHLDKMNRLEKAKKRLAYSKTLSRRLGSRSLAPDDPELLRKILASKKKKKKSKKKKSRKKKSRNKSRRR
jgi:hypothetical protein